MRNAKKPARDKRLRAGEVAEYMAIKIEEHLTDLGLEPGSPEFGDLVRAWRAIQR